MSKPPKMNREQRAERERGLVAAIVEGLVTTIEEQAKKWAQRAHELREGLSATAIKRAERLAHKLADEKPPGFVKAMEAMEIFDELCKHYGISKGDQSTMWGAVAQFCMFQLAAQTGPFFDAAAHYGLTVPSLNNVRLEVVRVRNPNCNCPNCRPRKPEELN